MFKALKQLYESSCRARIEFAEISDALKLYDNQVSHTVAEVTDFKRVAQRRQLEKQFERVFALFDVHECGLVSKSDISYYLLQIKDIVSAQLDFSLIKDFDTFQNDHREIDVKYFKDLIESIVR